LLEQCKRIRIQSLIKAVELDLEKEDWFAIWAESMGEDVP
jgi:predicted oxidoreductase